MTPAEQCQFINDLCNAVRVELTALVVAGKIPESWDGHELRELIFARASVNRSDIFLSEPRSKRVREYRNTVLVNNL